MSGIIRVLRHRLNNTIKGRANICAQSFNKNAGMPSGPVVILGLIRFNAANTSFSVNSNKIIAGCVTGEFIDKCDDSA